MSDFLTEKLIGTKGQRISAGLQKRVREQGLALGRPRSIPRQAVIDLAHQNISMSKIAKELRISKTAVFKIIKENRK